MAVLGPTALGSFFVHRRTAAFRYSGRSVGGGCRNPHGCILGPFGASMRDSSPREHKMATQGSEAFGWGVAWGRFLGYEVTALMGIRGTSGDV